MRNLNKCFGPMNIIDLPLKEITVMIVLIFAVYSFPRNFTIGLLARK